MTDFAVARQRMVAEQLLEQGIKGAKVLQAIGKVHRHLFLEQALWGRAYGDYPLPIGEKQTISQPFKVALMTEALELEQHDRDLGRHGLRVLDGDPGRSGRQGLLHRAAQVARAAREGAS